MDRLVDHLFVFEGDGVVTDFPGNYSQYRLSLREQLPFAGNQAAGKKDQTAETNNREQATVNKRKPSFKEKREFEILEKEISELTKEKETITQLLNNGSTPFEDLQRLSHRIGEVTSLLDEKELRWLELSEVM
jgi:ATP-binding cassette subfamily F protein uup